MKVRKFFAPSSREALKLVRAELGADAVVLSNRVVDGGVELVALTEDSLSGIVEDPATRSAAVAAAPTIVAGDAAARIEPALRSVPSMPIDADPFDDVEPFEGYGPTSFGGAAQPSPSPFGAAGAAGTFNGRSRQSEPGRQPTSPLLSSTFAGGAGNNNGNGAQRTARPAADADDLPGGFARRAFPTLQPDFDGPTSAQQGRRFTPRSEAPLAERSDRERRMARPVETREDEMRAQAEETPRPPMPYRSAPLHSPLTHTDGAGHDRTRALPGVLAAKTVGDDGASALAYVHRATQTAYLQQRRAREEAEAAGLHGSVAAPASGGNPEPSGADRMADAGWSGEARSPRQGEDEQSIQDELGGQARPQSAARAAAASSMNDSVRQGDYADATDGRADAVGAAYGHDVFGDFETNDYDERDHAEPVDSHYFLDEHLHRDAPADDDRRAVPTVPFARAAQRGQTLSGVAGLARPERDDEATMPSSVLGLARAERGAPEAQVSSRPARDAAGLQGHAATTPMTPSEAIARGLGMPGEVVVRPATMPREEQDRMPLPEAALLDFETTQPNGDVPTDQDGMASASVPSEIIASPEKARAESAVPAARPMPAREYGTTRYAAHTRVKASFATFPGVNPAIGNPTGSLRVAPSFAQTGLDASPVADAASASDVSAEAPVSGAKAESRHDANTDANVQSRDDAQARDVSASSDDAAASTSASGAANGATASADSSATLLNDAFPVDAQTGGDAASETGVTSAASAVASESAAPAPSEGSAAAAASGANSARSASAVLDEMRNLCGALGQQLEAIDQSERIRRDPVRNGVTQMMLACGFSAQLVRLMLDRLPAVGSAEEGLAWVKETFERNLPVLDNEDALMERGGVFALMGPTGVGKTTTTAKLAARAVMRHGADRVALLTTDSYRIGAHEQLRIYGRILGVAVHAVKDASDLSLVLSELRNKHMVLIDTIGMSQRDRAVSEQVAMLRGAQMPVKRLLLLNATSHGDTLNEVVRAYGSAINAAGGGNAVESESGLSGCIITKVDESNGIGAALDTVMRHRLPIHYVSNGQKVPEDLRVARRSYLIDNAFSDPHRASPFQPDAEALAMLFAGEDQRIAQPVAPASAMPGAVGGQPTSGEAHYGSSHG